MRWSWFKDSNERAGLVTAQGMSSPDPSYDSFHDTNSIKSGGGRGLSYFPFRRRNQALRQANANVRVLNKDGSRTFVPTNTHHRRRKRFTSDMFTTLLELKWRYILLTCVIAYFGSWLFFAGLWYLLVYFRGELELHFPPTSSPCITGVSGFPSVFLFSVETQHTIGYGAHRVTDQCTMGIFLLCLQSIVGVILEGLVVGLVFLKLSRPKKRSETLAFSRNAVIFQRNGKRYFAFRVADTRTSHLLEAHVRAQFVTKKVTTEGELITHAQAEMKIHGDGEKENRILLFWPTTMLHEIDGKSPLAHLTPGDFQMENATFEVIVVLEGVLETTGLMTQARSSYAPYEIRWGYRFRELNYFKNSSGQRILDYSMFDDIVQEESQQKE